jgi:hypothetical protein
VVVTVIVRGNDGGVIRSDRFVVVVVVVRGNRSMVCGDRSVAAAVAFVGW